MKKVVKSRPKMKDDFQENGPILGHGKLDDFCSLICLLDPKESYDFQFPKVVAHNKVSDHMKKQFHHITIYISSWGRGDNLNCM